MTKGRNYSLTVLLSAAASKLCRDTSAPLTQAPFFFHWFPKDFRRVLTSAISGFPLNNKELKQQNVAFLNLLLILLHHFSLLALAVLTLLHVHLSN